METETKKQSDLNLIAFWNAQNKDWRVTVIRTSLERFGYKMVLPYLSLFIILLGATKAQLGLITSMGMVFTALVGPLLGNAIDRNGPKKIYMVGILILVGCYLALASAKVWQVAALGMFLHQVGAGVGGSSCASICGNCLASCDRAKGMLVCESLAAGLLGMVGPMISGWYLVNVMGVVGSPNDPATIRPLFFMAALISVVSLVVVFFKLSDLKWSSKPKAKTNAFKDGMSILKADKNCFKWVFCAGVNRIPMAMVIPYVQVFAKEAKGASAAELAAIATATALTSVVSGYIIGIISDKIGRKPVIIACILLYCAGLLLLVKTQNTKALIVVGLLAGFQEIGAPVCGSMQNELVPRAIMGRWQGTVRFFASLWGAALAAVSGFIYDGIGGQWVFLIYIACELCIRIPILLTMPETLRYTVDESKFEHLL